MDDIKTFKRKNPVPQNRISKPNESVIIHQIIVFLTKIPNSRLFRNYGCTPVEGRDGVRLRQSSPLTPKGLPDLVFHFKGKSIYFEVKTPTRYKFIIKHRERLREEIRNGLMESNNHEKNQIKLMDYLTYQCGIDCFFVSSPEQVDTCLQNVLGIDYLQ